jgi:hypothetical protein
MKKTLRIASMFLAGMLVVAGTHPLGLTSFASHCERCDGGAGGDLKPPPYIPCVVPGCRRR